MDALPQQDIRLLELAADWGLLSQAQVKAIVERIQQRGPSEQPALVREELEREELLSEAELDYLEILRDRGARQPPATPQQMPAAEPVAVPPAPPAEGAVPVQGFEDFERLTTDELGDVYLARRKGTSERALVHLLDARLSADPEAVSELSREARAAKALHHPSILPLRDARFAEGRYCFLYEAPDGDSLQARVAQSGPLSESELVELGIQLASALEAAGRAGAPQRNLKPQAVYLSGRAAQLAGVGSALSPLRPGHAAGPLPEGSGIYYIAPEVARGEPGTEFRSQQYSLGALLYFAATGQPPFAGQTAAVVLARHLSDRPPSPAAFQSDLTRGLCDVIRKMMEKDPAARYESASELIEDLSAVQSGRLPQASTSTHRPPSSHAAVAVGARSPDVAEAAEEEEPPVRRRSGGVKIVVMLVLSFAMVASSAIVALLLVTHFMPQEQPLPPPPPPTPIPMDQEAREALWHADQYAEQNPHLVDQVRQYYELVMRHYPGSPEAQTAAERLKKLQEAGSTGEALPPLPSPAPLAAVGEAGPSAAGGTTERPTTNGGGWTEFPVEQPVEKPQPGQEGWSTAEEPAEGTAEGAHSTSARPERTVVRPPDLTGSWTGPMVSPAAARRGAPRQTPQVALRAAFGRGRQRCYISIACDSRYILYVNGREVGRGASPLAADIYPTVLKSGDVIGVLAEARRTGGLFAEVFLEGQDLSFGTDATWQWSATVGPGWNSPGPFAADWKNARIVDLYGGRTWGSPGGQFEPVGSWIWGEGHRVYFRRAVNF